MIVESNLHVDDDYEYGAREPFAMTFPNFTTREISKNAKQLMGL